MNAVSERIVLARANARAEGRAAHDQGRVLASCPHDGLRGIWWREGWLFRHHNPDPVEVGR